VGQRTTKIEQAAAFKIADNALTRARLWDERSGTTWDDVRFGSQPAGDQPGLRSWSTRLVTELASLTMPSFSPVATQLCASLRTFEASRQLSSSIYHGMPPGRVESLDVPSGQCGTCPVGAVYEGYDPVTVKEWRRWLVSR
jgi:hypothetical protein